MISWRERLNDLKEGWSWEPPETPAEKQVPPVSQPSDPVTLTSDGEFFPFGTDFRKTDQRMYPEEKTAAERGGGKRP